MLKRPGRETRKCEPTPLGGEIIADGKCPKCGTTVQISELTAEFASICNRILRKKGESVLFTKANVALCDPCYAEHKARRDEGADKALEILTQLQRQYAEARKGGASELDAMRDVPPMVRRDHIFQSWRKGWEGRFGSKRGGKEYKA